MLDLSGNRLTRTETTPASPAKAKPGLAEPRHDWPLVDGQVRHRSRPSSNGQPVVAADMA